MNKFVVDINRLVYQFVLLIINFRSEVCRGGGGGCKGISDGYFLKIL